jgi:hypothetical protein
MWSDSILLRVSCQYPHPRTNAKANYKMADPLLLPVPCSLPASGPILSLRSENIFSGDQHP